MRSDILNVIDMIQKSERNKNYKTYAIIAPSIESQFKHIQFGSLLSAIKLLGFHDIVEVAEGADAAAMAEAHELAEKCFLTSSCCPAFVDYVEKEFPDLAPLISHTPSPMALTGKMIKEKDPTAKVVFIGPCTAKKAEARKDSVAPYIDAVITFEELQALIDSRDIDVDTLPELELNKASDFGKGFARSGGLCQAVAEAIRIQNIDFNLKPIVCNGIEECRVALLKKRKNLLDANFIEGMACVGGCIGGAGCLTHGR